MKIKPYLKAALPALVSLGLAGFVQAQLTNTYINTFDTGGNTAAFSGAGSVNSWLYWYSIYGNVAITNDVTMDAGGDPNSGSLFISLPFGSSGNQQLFFGSFQDPTYAYNFNLTANGLNYSNISFDIHVLPGTPLNSAGNFGAIGVGFYQTGTMGDFVTIPASATNGWVHLVKKIDYTTPGINSVAGFLFNYNSYSGYPTFPFTFWMDNVALNLNAGPPPPPPTMLGLQTSVSGLTAIAGSPGQYDRNQISTVADTGYSFVGQSSVTYSWKIKSFPALTGNNFQQHFFIVNGSPGQYDQAADYNLADCIFITVQQNDTGVATMSFRYKTNEPPDVNGAHGNDMLFNNLSPTNSANTNLWPVMPVAHLNVTNGALGTWSVTFSQTTNVTLTGPDGSSTNFVMDTDAANVFADPVTLILGAQANNTNGSGKSVVIGNFSATGTSSPLADNFETDTNLLDLSTWKNLSNNTNCAVVVPPNSAYWLSWSLPDTGYSLLTTANLAKSNTWTGLPSASIIQINGHKQALIAATNLPSASHSFFSMIQRTYSQLAIVLPGQTFVNGVGVTGTPTDQNETDFFSVTVMAVDAANYSISGITDQVSVTSDDPGFIPPLNAALQNGTRTFQVQFGSPSPTNSFWHVMSTDQVNTAITGTSTGVIVQ